MEELEGLNKEELDRLVVIIEKLEKKSLKNHQLKEYIISVKEEYKIYNRDNRIKNLLDFA
jgi:hypothetical protein